MLKFVEMAEGSKTNVMMEIKTMETDVLLNVKPKMDGLVLEVQLLFKAVA